MNDIDIKLRSCPFCGSWKSGPIKITKNTKVLYRITCDRCCSSGPMAYNEPSARKLWNERKGK